jgi:pyridinium-3,5-bisthiocarboxylic acid mononucleotide nickel chelatase
MLFIPLQLIQNQTGYPMPKLAIAYLDCQMGVSEEMLLGAYCDAGFDLALLERALIPSSLHNYALHLHHVKADQRTGISGTRVTLVIDGEESSHLYHGHAQGLSYPSIAAIVQTIVLDEHARSLVMAMARRLMAAQAAIADSTIGDVYWSEQEAARALLMMSAVVMACNELSIGQLLVSPLPLSGTLSGEQDDSISTALTMEILRHVQAPWRPNSIPSAIVTPLAATILAEIASFEPPEMVFRRIGYGFASPEQGHVQSYLRLCLGQTRETVVEDMDVDHVVVIESNLDTMTGELLGALVDRLLALGALDVSYTAIQMKKNRPATMITVICKKGDEQLFANLLLRETTTLGVRIQPMMRYKAQREQVQIETQLGPVFVKVKRLGKSFVNAVPEYEECQRVANEHTVPLIDVYEVVRVAISKAIEQGTLDLR